MLKVALVGVGGISGAHIPAWESMADTELVALCDIRPEQMEKYTDKRRYTDFDEMLEKEEIDILDICLPTYLHADFSVKAMERGINVLCEKPMADSTAAAEQMLEAAKRSGKLLQIGFVCRYGRDCKLIEELRDKDFFGDFYYAKATYLRRHGSPTVICFRAL